MWIRLLQDDESFLEFGIIPTDLSDIRSMAQTPKRDDR